MAWLLDGMARGMKPLKHCLCAPVREGLRRGHRAPICKRKRSRVSRDKLLHDFLTRLVTSQSGLLSPLIARAETCQKAIISVI
jgi:hypothetical protein